jgi:hypothetical protein
MKRLLYGTLAVAAAISQVADAALIDDFNTVGSSANYVVTSSSADTAVTFGYDYGAFGIPSAPNSTDSSTIGVKMEANIALPTSIEAVTLHSVQSFSGKYTVQYDAWVNANGPFPGGGAGSTEYITFGIGSDGATVNRHNFSAGSPSGIGSGAWFAASGEGQSSQVDYNAMKGATFQLPATGQYAAGNTTGAGGARDNSNAYYTPILPTGVDTSLLPYQGASIPVTGFAQQNGVTQAGIFGFKWHEVLIEVDSTGGTGGAGSAKWYIDGLLIATLDAGANGSFSTSGSVNFGYLDPFTSVSNNAALSFGLIDNLVVTVIPEPTTVVLSALGVLGLVAARRRVAA